MSGLSFSPDAIKALAEILRQTDLTEIELVEKDSRIRVAREVTVAAPVVTQMAAPAMQAVPAPVSAPPPAAAEAPLSHANAVTSPMVGVAYLSPEPGAAPFITQGQHVSAGQTLLLIEAMKTFNQIKATKSGTVTRILIENGTPVEFGEPLMVIE
ncbi:Biotin carboxyl carrier protein of acetyl-CoA carboxylase [Roseomonas mucosa]|jgi:acetyl-CoA carboxylase biotin carboxyl carrier protein|uniref:Biotin carboxyl carrier protein of acetyl-CoA carboxylase n=1 Tax=Roseomonas mucosa TaxID=207340 RepID=A0A1S8D907_9PROT|nr:MULTISPECIES: acetyl-CoA carboxylase biotin carboxyl carrier protein [Roseomonas]MBS5901573.1 acetyl-CoA carboxylase biotin carboxyl carrier protein [Acetobacteraceae bacterium]ATR19928.1 acetyl-CoA carboxylase, biotin carboxyl carrier protein [Roseomonas sp. FDAARGOS_362]AWV23636.1 Biotin carboxyl carrier protein of acetyl-CoA carboxylase [Roseomonas mucosa]MCG7350700.1 acetyl-CoA carboxylase biotin carboxyl carrier protein [Roseomonas mucosa]MCG7355903.1 acetyl-CoA carboxylase biotin carb